MTPVASASPCCPARGLARGCQAQEGLVLLLLLLLPSLVLQLERFEGSV